MRGKPLCSQPPTAGNRITPADAGKTLGFSFPFDVYKDHPRGCGENLGLDFSGVCREGSPPRMRGKPRLCDSCRYYTRITPADAGKTFWKINGYGNLEDHPRGCGENSRFSRLLLIISGSPPRMRGKREWATFRRLPPRITPADAGKTCKALEGAV